MKIYYPPFDIFVKEKEVISLADNDGVSIFLGGSIEMGNCDNWQAQIIEHFKYNKDIIFLNPRRPDWDATQEQKITNPYFKEQVDWELNGLEASDLVIFYIDPKTKSAITLMELGLYAKSKKVIVCCPEGFYRKGNVDIICQRYNIKQVKDINKLIQAIEEYV